MKKLNLLVLGFLFFLASCGDGFQYVEIETEKGNMKFKLYNSTPLHRDNFVKLAKDGFYDDLLFHRVMNNFMAQGGDPQSRGAAPGARLGVGGPGYKIPSEAGAPHFKGTLAAAKQGGDTESSGSQFYIVQGKAVSEQLLNAMEQRKKITYTPEQRKKYMDIGGEINLDMDYTVFGEIVSGMDVIDKICAIPVDRNNRPLQDLKMKIKLVK